MKHPMPANVVRAPHLADEGARKIEWVRRNMPVLRSIEQRFAAERPFEGLSAAVSVHLEAKTAYLAHVIAAGGAQVAVTGSNPLSTKDDVVAALDAAGLHVYARHAATGEQFAADQRTALSVEPHIVIDDGGDLVHHLHETAADHADSVLGACEETTAGVLRNRARAAAGKLRFPVLAVNDAHMKHLFDNRYGTGQSTMDAIMRTTNLVVTGKTVVVVGYGWCGRGIAERAAGLGANVIVTEVDEIKALEALMDGYRVMPIVDALPAADFVVTATGVRDAVAGRHIDALPDGIILANAGHFYDEIPVPDLASAAIERREVRDNLTGYRLQDGRWVYVIAEGKIVNISAADGHPAEIMDTSFAVQALAAEYVVTSAERRADRLVPGLAAEVLPVPAEIDRTVATLKLRTLGVTIDTLSRSQREYLAEFEK